MRGARRTKDEGVAAESEEALSTCPRRGQLAGDWHERRNRDDAPCEVRAEGSRRSNGCGSKAARRATRLVKGKREGSERMWVESRTSDRRLTEDESPKDANEADRAPGWERQAGDRLGLRGFDPAVGCDRSAVESATADAGAEAEKRARGSAARRAGAREAREMDVRRLAE
jgi:hypothetical protein